MAKPNFQCDYCERCGERDLSGWTTSWFNTETICLTCSSIEDKIIEKRPESRAELEAIGRVPEVNFDYKWGEELK